MYALHVVDLLKINKSTCWHVLYSSSPVAQIKADEHPWVGDVHGDDEENDSADECDELDDELQAEEGTAGEEY